MNKVKVNIIGLGGIAQITHLPLLSKMEETEITGVCDIDKSKAKLVAQKYNLKNYYTDLDNLLAETDADCIIISSPTYMHEEHAVKSLEKGLNVLVEKPLGRNVMEAQRIVDTAKKNKRKLMVGMNNLFRPDIMMLQSFTSANSLGDIFYIKSGFIKKRSSTGSWILDKNKSGGGVVMDLGIVILELAVWLMKYPKVKSVSASNFFHSTNAVEDSSFVMIRTDKNHCISLEASWSLPRENDLFYCNVFGTEGSASINPLRIYKRMHGNLVNVTPVKMETPANIYKRSYEYELKHFISAIMNNTELISGGEEALERMKIVESIYKSAKIGKEVEMK